MRRHPSRSRNATATAAAAIATLLLLTAATTVPTRAQAPDPALERLNASPRHHEWVEVKRGDHTVHAFVVYPETSDKVPAVLVIHENRGLTDWVRGVADQLAEHGYIAVAPDLLSGMAPGGGKTSDFADSNAARDAIYKLQQEDVTADLHAIADHALALPAANGTLAVGGFCWGGSQTFHFATQRKDLAAAFPFYGTAPADAELFKAIACPVHGFYGGNDERVNATLDATSEAMKAAGKSYDPVIYGGAGHGFMRQGEAPDASTENRTARDQAWQRWLALLGEL